MSPRIKAKRCTATITVNKRKIRCALPEGHETAKLPNGDVDYDRFSTSHETRGTYTWEFHPEHVTGMLGVTIPARTSRSGFTATCVDDKFEWEHEPGNKDCPCYECIVARNREYDAKREAEEATSNA